jgi:hypothetical protein
MAGQKKTKTGKGSNGTGSTVTLYFDVNDPAERKALNGARLLAAKHGRRKQAIVALLEAVYTCYEETGELMSASTISGALMGQGIAPARQGVGSAATVMQTHELPSDTITRSTGAKKQRGSHVEVTGISGKANAETVAKNFLSSMKGLASGFFD